MFPVMAAAAVLGSAVSTLGKLDANQAQADAERRNAAWYEDQADYARDVGERKRNIFKRQAEQVQGRQMSAFAKAGVDISSSSLFLSQQLFFAQQEDGAIKQEADMNVRLAKMKAQEANRVADNLTSNETKNMIGIQGVLGAVSGGMGGMSSAI